jgi:hypothetical protein
MATLIAESTVKYRKELGLLTAESKAEILEIKFSPGGRAESRGIARMRVWGYNNYHVARGAGYGVRGSIGATRCRSAR